MADDTNIMRSFLCKHGHDHPEVMRELMTSAEPTAAPTSVQEAIQNIRKVAGLTKRMPRSEPASKPAAISMATVQKEIDRLNPVYQEAARQLYDRYDKENADDIMKEKPSLEMLNVLVRNMPLSKEKALAWLRNAAGLNNRQRIIHYRGL